MTKATSAEDAAALFDLPPSVEPPSQEASTDAEEAALAAELAAVIESGGVADDAPESRIDLRVEADWPARLTLPGGRVVELQVRNISEGGVGLASDEPVPAHAVVDLEMAVPLLDEAGGNGAVKGTIKTTYTVAQAARIHFGGTWQAPPDGLELVKRWIARRP